MMDTTEKPVLPLHVRVRFCEGLTVAGMLGTTLVGSVTVQGQFTIPSSILSLLPANGYGIPGTPGVNIQVAGIPSNPYFTAPGTPGINVGAFSAFISTGKVVPIQ